MPELPEVEVLVRHLEPLLLNKTVRCVQVHRKKSIRPTSSRRMRDQLVGAKFKSIKRRAKYLLFEMKPSGRAPAFILLGTHSSTRNTGTFWAGGFQGWVSEVV